MKQKSRILAIALVLAIAVTLTASLALADGADNAFLDATGPVTAEMAERIVNLYADCETEYTVESLHRVRSMADDGEAYTLALLAPQGYAVLATESGKVIELCLEEAPEVLTAERTEPLYYAGPMTFATKTEQSFRDAATGEAQSADKVSKYLAIESRILGTEKSLSELLRVIDFTTVDVSASYFSGLTDYGYCYSEPYLPGTAQASFIYLYYFQTQRNVGEYVSGTYAQGRLNTVFQALYGETMGSYSADPRPVSATNAQHFMHTKNGLNEYISDLPASLPTLSYVSNVTNTKNQAYSSLTHGNPVMAAMIAGTNRPACAVIVYGCKYPTNVRGGNRGVPDGLIYRVHYANNSAKSSASLRSTYMTADYFDAAIYF